MTLAKQGRPRTHERAADPRTSSMQNLSFHDLGRELQLGIFSAVRPGWEDTSEEQEEDDQIALLCY